jgi:Bacterial SH3 domain
MAQRATGTAKKSTPSRAGRVGGAARALNDAPSNSRPIPLALAPLLSPYKKHGRLSVRIERLPRLARLSAGRNNGDRSWSLGLDELEDLTYLPPDGMDEAHTLAMRIIGLDGGGSTLAVLDLSVSPEAQTISGPDAGSDALDSADSGDGSEATGLRREVARLKATLAAADAERAKAREEAGQTKREFSAQALDAKLAEVRADFEAELKEKLAAAEGAASAYLAGQRKGWAAEEAARAKEWEKQAEAALADARAQWQRQQDRALGAAEAAWKKAEEARFAELGQEWQEKLSRALAEAGSTAKSAVSKTHAAEIGRLNQELAAAKTRAAEHAKALKDARADIEATRERWQREAQDALRKAENEWTGGEAARLTAIDAHWQEKLARALKEAREEWRREADAALAGSESERTNAEAARLADVETKWNAKLKSAVAKARTDTETSRVRELEADLESLRAELARARAAIVEAEDGRTAAEKDWKAAEAARIAAIDAEWRQKLEQVATVSHRSAQARTDEEAAELRRLQDDIGGLQTGLAERDQARAKAEAEWAARSAAELARAQELEAALARSQAELREARTEIMARDKASAAAEKVWKAGETARLAALDAQWQQKLASAVADAETNSESSDRAHAAERESMLAELTQAEAALREREAAFIKAAEDNQAAEAARIAAIEAQWQARLAAAQADATAGADGLARTHAETIRRLEDALALTRGEVSVRDEALSKAEQERKTGEAARKAAIDAQEKLAQALADARAAADIRDETHAGELRRMRDELAVAQASLVERTAALADVHAKTERARERWERESREALGKAEEVWKSAEAARAAAAETRWHERLAHGAAETRAAADARDAAHAIALNQLREQVATLQTKATEREAEAAKSDGEREAAESARLAKAERNWEAKLAKAVADARAEAKLERDRVQRENRDAFLSAQKSWKVEEAARLKEARAEWRKESGAGLAEATQRYQAAESALAQLRRENSGPHGRDDSELGRLRDEFATLQAAFTQQQQELANAHGALEACEVDIPSTKIVLHSDRGMPHAENQSGRQKRSGSRLLRDTILVASIAGVVSVALFFPPGTLPIPPAWQSHLTEVATKIGIPPALAPAATPVQTAPLVATKLAAITHGANLRAAASGSAEVIGDLSRGDQVDVLETRGQWTHVRIAASKGKPAQEGWVYAPYVKEASAGANRANDVSAETANATDATDAAKNTSRNSPPAAKTRPTGAEAAANASANPSTIAPNPPRSAATRPGGTNDAPAAARNLPAAAIPPATGESAPSAAPNGSSKTALFPGANGAQPSAPLSSSSATDRAEGASATAAPKATSTAPSPVGSTGVASAAGAKTSEDTTAAPAPRAVNPADAGAPAPKPAPASAPQTPSAPASATASPLAAPSSGQVQVPPVSSN